MPFAVNNGVRIYWEETGNGPPLLLIMGLGYAHQMWHRTTPVVAKHFRTILLDNRGVGQSDLPPGPYPIQTMAADAAAVLDAAGRSEEHTSELQSHVNLVCRLLLEKKKTKSKLLTFEKQKKKRKR